MFACAYFLYSDTIFSYTGFIAVEVIFISTLGASLLLLDATTALRCKVKDKDLSSVVPANAARLALGADYESEDEMDGKKLRKKLAKRTKLNQADELGADQNEPNKYSDTEDGISNAQRVNRMIDS